MEGDSSAALVGAAADLDVARGKDGKTRIAYVAQGRETDAKRDFKKLYVAELP